jgi:hypothetical protein
MKILEISTESRKQIKMLHNLYISYILGESTYSDLSDLISNLKKYGSRDVLREVDIVNQTLIEEIIRILSK